MPKNTQGLAKNGIFTSRVEGDRTLLLLIGILIFFGIVMLWSASSFLSFQKFGDNNYLVKHQVLYGLLIGGIAFLVTAKLDYHIWRKYAFPLMVITIVLLVLVLIPGIGFYHLGARRWINFGGILFQPTELAKLTFLIYLATWFEKRDKHVEDFAFGFLSFVFLLGIIGVLIMLQPDMGTMTVIAFIALIAYFVAGARLRHLVFMGLGGLGLFGILVKIAPYRADRLSVFLNPELDPQGIGYHVNQALLAIGTGGWLGVGLGHSRQKLNYLPEVTGDSIFAVIAEEMGFIISMALLVLFAMIMSRGIDAARRAPDTFGKILATGITCWFTFQAFVNIAAMLSLVPLTGIPLPLVSYGSSSFITLLAALGILVNISSAAHSSLRRT